MRHIPQHSTSGRLRYARRAMTARMPWRTTGRQTGSVTLEMVLALPVWVGLLLFVVMCGRLVSAQLDVDAAAHNAARAASLARTTSAAQFDAQQAAEETLSGRKATCGDVIVKLDAAGLQPGVPVRVEVSCTARLSDLGLLGISGSRTVSSTSVSPVDSWRGH